MGKDAERERRQRELEEKKKKLLEYKNRGKKEAPKEEKKETSTAQGEIGSKIKNLDDFLSTLDQVIPTSQKKQEEKENDVEEISHESQEEKNIEVEEKRFESREKVHEKLSIQTGIAQIDIPPKEIVTYSKMVQTEESALQKEENIEEDSEMKKPHPHGESSFFRKPLDLEDTKGDKSTDENKEDENQKYEEEKSLFESVEKEKILRSEDFLNFLDRSSKIVERAMYVEQEYDIFVDYAQSEGSEEQNKGQSEMSFQTKLFDERWSKHRSITHVSWSFQHTDLIAASYSKKNEGMMEADGLVLVWSAQNTLNRPEYRFFCQSQVMVTQFSQFSPTVIVGGTYSGQLFLWDMRVRKQTPVQHSSLSSEGHTHPIYNLSIVGTSNAHNLVSVSTDGKMCVWSLENLSTPQESLLLTSPQSGKVPQTSIAVTSLSFPDTDINSFIVGTEEGAIYRGYRHAKEKNIAERFQGHHGPVTSVDFHPSKGTRDFSDLFISSSTDWSCKLWSTKSTKYIYSFEDAADYIYDTKWCPTHPSIFATVDGTGHLSMWNLNLETEIPVQKEKVSSTALSCVSWSPDGKKITVGDSAGYLHVYDTKEITNPRQDEWNIFSRTLSNLTVNESQNIFPC